jgi:isopentenyl-diphosphate delta-isomerase
MHRAPTERLRRLAAAFADWGLPTAESLVAVRQVRDALGMQRSVSLIASGGIRTGQDVGKCVALGADLVGLAGPFLKKAVQGAEAAAEEMELLEAELRISMFCSGARTLEDLRLAGVVVRTT